MTKLLLFNTDYDQIRKVKDALHRSLNLNSPSPIHRHQSGSWHFIANAFANVTGNPDFVTPRVLDVAYSLMGTDDITHERIGFTGIYEPVTESDSQICPACLQQHDLDNTAVTLHGLQLRYCPTHYQYFVIKTKD